jgi:hypothetical protein
MPMRNFLIACSTVLICRLLAAYTLPTYDDAFITYRYAQNLVAGKGLVYNSGEKVMGTTAPLFAIIACLPVILTVSVQKFFLFFNLFCEWGILYCVYVYFFKKKSLLLFFLFTSLFALDPIINRVSIGGMEADLFLLVSFSGIILYLKGRKNLAAILLASAYFLRPEAIILLLVMFSYDWYHNRRFPLLQTIIVLLGIGIPLCFIYGYYGQILPQSVVAKSSIGREPLIPLIQNILIPDPLFYLIFPLALIGFVENFRKDIIFGITGTWLMLYILAYILKAPHTWSWYFYSTDVIQLIFASLGLYSLLMRLRKGREIRAAYQAWIFSLPLFVWFLVALIRGRSGVEKNVYGELEKDFRHSVRPSDNLFFADDIGALGFFTGGSIYDNQKLVTPWAAIFPDARERIVHVWPDYLFIYCDPTYQGLMENDPVLSKRYRFIKRYAVGGEKGYPEKAGLSNRFKQDYILFKRID